MNNADSDSTYSRVKTVTVTFDGMARDYTLVAPSAKDMAEARKDAQRIHTDTVRRLPAMAETLRTVFLLQEPPLLIEAALEAESEEFTRKAALTLVEGDPEHEAKLAVKVEAHKDARRQEMAAWTQDQLADKLVGAEVNRQLAAALHGAISDAIVVRSLHDSEGKRLFAAVEDMQAALPEAVLATLYGALLEMLTERGDAQVFPKPHISNGSITMPGDMG
jgi:hypothetical protein